MREASVYLTSQFYSVWSNFQMTLKSTRARADYFSYACMICDDCQCDFFELTPEECQNYFNQLINRENHLTKKTIHTRLSSLRSIGTYTYENRISLGLQSYENPFYRVQVPDYDERIQKEDIPSLEELDRLLVACKDDKMVFVILSLVIRCALTASEVCKLRTNQFIVDKLGRSALVFQFHDKVRYVKVPEDIAALLSSYIQENSSAGEYIFYNQWHNVLKVRNLESLIKKYWIAAKITKEFTIQDVRNTSIATMLAAGGSYTDVADYVNINAKWMYRFDGVIESINHAPVDLVHIQIVP